MSAAAVDDGKRIAWDWVRTEPVFERVGEFGLDPWGCRAERLAALAVQMQEVTAFHATLPYHLLDEEDE